VEGSPWPGGLRVTAVCPCASPRGRSVCLFFPADHCCGASLSWARPDVCGPKEAECEGTAVETGFARSFRPSSVRCVAWVVRSCSGEGQCQPQMMMALETSFPLRMLRVWSTGWLLTRLRVGILNFLLPDFCCDESTAERIPPGCGCVCPVSDSTLPALGCSCPAPRGGSRAAQVLAEELSFALFVGSCV